MKYFTSSFLLSLILLQYSSEVMDLRWLLLVLVGFFLAVQIFIKQVARKRFFVVLMICLGAGTGLLRFYLAVDTSVDNGVDDLVPESIRVQGKVLDIPKERGSLTTFLLRITESDKQSERLTSNVIKLMWYKSPIEVLPDQILKLKVKVKPVHGFVNPGGFDTETAALAKGIHWQGYVMKDVSNTCILKCQSSITSISSLRLQLKNKIDDLLKENQHSGLLIALSLGDRSGISIEDWQLMSKLGIGHLMAISGLHIGMIAGGVFVLGLFLFRRSAWLTSLWPHECWAAVFAILGACMYATLAGFGLPTQRALIMVSLFMLSVILSRKIQAWRLFSSAILIVLLLDPWSIQSYGFWLSFGAVGLILYAFSYRIERPKPWLSLIQLQWVLGLGLLPLSLAFFQQASIAGFFVNLFMIPLVSFWVLPFTLAGLASIYLYEPVAVIFLNAADWALTMIWPLLKWISSLQLSAFSYSPTSKLAVFFALTGILLLLVPKGISGRWLVPLFLLPLVFKPVPRPAEGDVWMDVLDVGQGTAILIQTHTHNMIYDPGPRYGRFSDAVKKVVAPALQARGVDSLDLVVVSHSDSDHSGGLKSLLDIYPEAPVISGTPERLVKFKMDLCQSGQEWVWDNVRFKVLSPSSEDTNASPNNRSCVIQVFTKKAKILLAGDIESKQEAKLLQKYGKSIKSDVLLAPHHGSSTSSSAGFIKMVAPTSVIYSAGYKNRYKMPSSAVVSRYKDAGIKAWSTAEQGTIQVRLSDNISIKSYRDQIRPLWRDIFG